MTSANSPALSGTFSYPKGALSRRIYPELFASKIVSVQPMSGPVGIAYALRYTYGANHENKIWTWIHKGILAFGILATGIYFLL